jgi:hypothetical protein
MKELLNNYLSRTVFGTIISFSMWVWWLNDITDNWVGPIIGTLLFGFVIISNIKEWKL